MKSLLYIVLLSLSVSLTTSCRSPKDAACASTGIPGKLDIPADFKPQERVDFVRANKRGKFMGLTRFRGRELRKMNGVRPIYVVMTNEGRLKGDPVKVGDIILGVGGSPLGDDPVYQFKSKMGDVVDDTGFVTITRWRDGEVANVALDLNIYPPDLTAGEEPTELHDWQLGPTGLNGWVYNLRMEKGASRDARQILVTLVEAGSPADGKVQVDDVILGVDGKKFSYDARKAFAGAINEAEKAENSGELELLVWRPSTKRAEGEGKELSITITLEVMPDPSPSSPYDCEKTDEIIENGVKHILANKEDLLKPGQGWLNYINALGLLATGREDVMPAVKEFAHANILKDGEKLSIQKHVGMMCWWWSYKTVFMCEYYLRTGDETVLPTIEEYATKIAMGQSGVGTWGHTYAAIENAGRMHGPLGGYGAINQQGLTLMIALPLAWKCGVRNDEVRDAIKRGDIFFSYYIDKGAIPYGDHSPNTKWFDDNGKSGSAALMFDLLDKPDGASFYSSMVVGSAPTGREAGHTGCFWSHLWGGVGAARAGKEGMIAFMDEMNWAFTLERHWKGRLSFQGNAGEDGDRGQPKTKWDCTGARLLQLSVPRSNLYVTGRDMTVPEPMTEDRIEYLLDTGQLYTDSRALKKLTVNRIKILLGDELPAVRILGAKAIELQKLDMVDELVEMLESDKRYEQYGACYALKESGYGSEKAVQKLIEIIEDSDDLDLRLNALDALTGEDPETSLSGSSKAAIPALLNLSVERFDIDPRRLLQRRLCNALFGRFGLIKVHGIKNVDSDLLVPAIRELLTVDDGRARGSVGTIFDALREEDRQALWNDIYIAVRDMAPSGIMFADQVRSYGLDLMMKHNIEEGIDLTLAFMQEERWGEGGRQKKGIEILRGYGPSAAKALPYLRDLKKQWVAKKKDDDVKKLEGAISVIESGDPAELQSISSFIE